MKLKIVQLLMLVITLSSCEREIETYSGDVGIYFEGKIMSDTLEVSWAYYADTVQTLRAKIRVLTLGKPTNYDRSFKMTYVEHFRPEEKAVEGVDYSPFSYEGVIPAGESYMDLKIDLLRNPELLSGTPRVFTFKLEENENFKFIYNRFFSMKRLDEHGDTIKFTRYIDTYRTFKISEEIPIQSWWLYETKVGYKYLGKWSVKKSLLICNLMKIDRKAWFSGNLILPTTESYIKFLGRYMYRWLQENPTYEEDGTTLMEMGEEAKK